MHIRYPSLGLPPTTPARANGTRLEVSEGGRWRRVLASDNVVDVREFGAIGFDLGSNETRDTDAMQQALTYFSNASPPGGRCITGKLVVPTGLELFIGQTLVYIGSPSYSIDLIGESGRARSGTGGSSLTWTGNLGGCLIHFRGVNGSTVRGMQFNGNARADVCFWGSEWYQGPASYDGTQVGSSGLAFEHCIFNNPRASATATPMKVGLDNGVTSSLQADSYRWRLCDFAGNGAGPGLAGIYIASPGNTKVFSVEHANFSETDFGFYQPSGSGSTVLFHCEFSNIGYNQDGAAIYMGSGDTLQALSCLMENDTTGYRARMVSTANGVLASIHGGYLSGNMPSDDYAMVLGGPTSLHGFCFKDNNRAGSNILKVQCASGLDLKACSWQYNTTVPKNVPVHDGSNNHIIDSDVYRSNSALPSRLTAAGNMYAPVGVKPTFYFPDINTRKAATIRGAMWVDAADGVNAGVTVEEEDGKLRITIPYTAFQTGALTSTITITKNTARTWIRNVQDRVLTAFAGTAGTLQLEVGTSVSINAHLLSHDVKTLDAEKGVADADLGASLASATRAHWKGHYLPATLSLQAKLTSSSGNLSGLSAGSVVITYDYDYVGA